MQKKEEEKRKNCIVLRMSDIVRKRSGELFNSMKLNKDSYKRRKCKPKSINNKNNEIMKSIIDIWKKSKCIVLKRKDIALNRNRSTSVS